MCFFYFCAKVFEHWSAFVKMCNISGCHEPFSLLTVMKEGFKMNFPSTNSQLNDSKKRFKKLFFLPVAKAIMTYSFDL